MSYQFAALQKRALLVWIAVASLLLATVLPLLASSNTANAAQITSRAVHISDSVAGATDVEYEVEFVVATTGVVGALAIQYCDDSPIVGDSTCADARSFDWAEGTLVLSNQNGTNSTGTVGDAGVTDWVVDDSTDTNGLVLTSATAASLTAGDIVTFTIGGAGVADGVTNPTGSNTAFYLRTHTYTALTSVPCTTGATCDGAGTDFDFDNASLNNVDDGGVALSTASQLTINARVQEVLTFTVGTDAAADDCAALAGDTIDLGVLDTAGINRASTDPSTDTNVGCGEVTTNAANGVQIFYVGDDMKVGAAVCSGSTDDDGGAASDVDQCLNRDADADAGTLTTGISAGDEMWGIGVSNLGSNAGSNITSNLSTVAAYDIDTAPEYSFVPNSATEFVNSTTVVNTETFELDAAATASITTPTGLYSTTLTFIATATF